MLHILWMILKIILITLGILLGLVLLLLLLVLFVPIRYRASGSRHGEDIGGEARISWLLSAISATAVYRDGSRSVCIRIFGISLETLKKLKAKLRRKKSRPQAQIPDRGDSGDRKKSETAPHPAGKRESIADDDRPAPSKEPVREREPEDAPREESISEEVFPDGTPREGKPAAVWGGIAAVWGKLAALCAKICRIARGIWSALVRVFRKILGIPGRIRRFFHRISLTITGFYGKIDRWRSFLQDERTVAGLRLGWGELKKLLGHIAPRKITGNLLIGMDNPAATGQVLALIGATIPLHGNRVAVEPVFDRKVLEADVRMRGRICLFYVVIMIVKLYFDKNIKYIMKEFNKEG